MLTRIADHVYNVVPKRTAYTRCVKSVILVALV